jgi:hypothetical protein
LIFPFLEDSRFSLSSSDADYCRKLGLIQYPSKVKYSSKLNIESINIGHGVPMPISFKESSKWNATIQSACLPSSMPTLTVGCQLPTK